MFIDAHSHLDKYEEDLESALNEINQHGIFTISNSMDLPSWARNLVIADRCDLVLPTLGVHPWNASEYVNCLEDLDKPIIQSSMIGEIGLDHHYITDASLYPAQTKVCEFFLATASQQGKIVNLHTKGAEEEVLHLLRHYNIQRAIVHWYSGPLDVLRAMVDHGFYFTVGVAVLYSQHVQTIARNLPSDLLLTETDNPGGPQSLTGTRGRPLLIKDVIHKLAELRKVKTEVIIDIVQTNCLRLINDDPWISESYSKLLID